MHNNIKKARSELKISQLEMSHLLNVSRQSYIDIENGTRIPRADLLLNISLITNKEISFFYNEHNSSKLDHIAFLLRNKTDQEKNNYLEILESLIQKNKNNHLS
ncbi:helix-turn-helix transcriptional regulator [Photobacterium aquimaris]|uniref:Helix-turn-helix domain protein n=1 Tax=Photobacterium aquimaris TaxID=512643 RepID=A0A1Y6KTP2_9GAMM|nr:helix-turn-helix transcriptional regulator [Photobacterium aquimaris]SMY15414.1 Helix-turn-helix domain protein [Photobacterium aquimaris]